MNLDEYVRDREARDPEFRAAGEALRPRHTFQHALVAARLAAGLTQQQLADLLDKPQSAVARWESGQHQPRLEILQAVAAALGGSFTITPEQEVLYRAPHRARGRAARRLGRAAQAQRPVATKAG
ncbi:MAG TPA: helix-turn-helix transcriptional regulator [Chloroflexota bacterium]|nr:helix-turn-helix transcriptional regulator [Chloroflexota bacterium]